MNGDFFIVYKYLARYWALEFEEIKGYELLYDLKTVFGFSDEILKPIIIEWFSEFKISDDWWENKFDMWCLETARGVVLTHPIYYIDALPSVLPMGVPQRYFGGIDPANINLIPNDVKISVLNSIGYREDVIIETT